MRHTPITAQTHSFESCIARTKDNMERGAEREFDITVEYQIIPGCAQTYGQPGEPSSVEILSVRGVDFDLTEWEYEQLEQEAAEHAADMAEDDAAAYADYRYEQYRDRQMMDRWERGE